MDTVYNKITVNGKTLIDISSDTVDAEHLMQGYTAHDSSGVQITGTAIEGSGTALIVDTTDSHGGIIREITTDTEVKLQGRKTVTPTSQTQIITADTGYDGIVEVEVEGATGLANVYQDENGVLVLDSEGTDWQRPSEWMPYANGWDDDDFDGCYFVYDLIDNNEMYPSWYAISCDIYPNQQYIVECGYIDSTGTFSVIDTTSYNDNAVACGILPIWDKQTLHQRFYVVRATSSSGANIQKVSLSTPTSAVLSTIYGNGISANSSHRNVQPCIEIYGRLPYVTIVTLVSYNLKHVNLIDLISLTSLNGSFRDCYKLEKIDGMETWDTSNITTLAAAFQNCSNLIDFSGLENWDVGKVDSINYAFSNIGAIEVNLGNWESNSIIFDSNNAFRESRYIKKVTMPQADYSNKTSNDTFRSCYCLENIIFPVLYNPLQTSYTFNTCNKLKNLDFSKLNVGNSSNMNLLFNNCYYLEKIDFSEQNTSEITTMQSFANYCHSLKIVDFTNCDFSNVTDTNTTLFSNCENLVRLKGFVYYQSFILTQSTLMPAENLVEVLTNLPTVESAKTITLGSTNKKKLTAEQIAIATEKGWTVA